MQITISKQLRYLRNDRGNTQEELADHLGVTVQAVSKWERGEGCPEISFLPLIASFYKVSVDTLLGVDEAAKEKRANEIAEQYFRSVQKAKINTDGTIERSDAEIEMGMEIIRKGLSEIPDSWYLMQILASDLWGYAKRKNIKDQKPLLDEAEQLCRKILKEAPYDCPWRHCANEILCLTLYEQGNKQQAIEIAENLPGAVGSLDNMLPKVLEGKDLERQLNISIREFIRLAYGCVQMHSENNFGKERLRSQSAVKIQLDAIKTYLDNK